MGIRQANGMIPFSHKLSIETFVHEFGREMNDRLVRNLSYPSLKNGHENNGALTIDEIFYKHISIKQLDMNLGLREGRFYLAPSSANLLDGTIAFNAIARATNTLEDFAFNLSLSNIDTRKVNKKYQNLSAIPTCPQV